MYPEQGVGWLLWAPTHCYSPASLEQDPRVSNNSKQKVITYLGQNQLQSGEHRVVQTKKYS